MTFCDFVPNQKRACLIGIQRHVTFFGSASFLLPRLIYLQYNGVVKNIEVTASQGLFLTMAYVEEMSE